MVVKGARLQFPTFIGTTTIVGGRLLTLRLDATFEVRLPLTLATNDQQHHGRINYRVMTIADRLGYPLDSP